jgi:membrane-associated protein
VFDEIVDQVSSGWAAYPLIFAIVLGDAIVPVLPGETAIITGGILSSNGDLSWVFVLVSGALGAFAGDNIVYWLGRSGGQRLADRFFSSEKSTERRRWARGQLDERGSTIIATARFIPGGRTATTFTAGTVAFPWRRFATADIVGALLWSSFATALGVIGGHAFEESLWKPLVLALAFGALVAFAGEALRRRREARS